MTPQMMTEVEETAKVLVKYHKSAEEAEKRIKMKKILYITNKLKMLKNVKTVIL